MLPLDSFFHFEALPESSPPSLTQAPSQFAGYFKLDTTPRNNKPFRLPLIQQPADGAAFQDPIFAGLEFLRLPRVLKEEERVREVEQLDAFRELAVEETDEVEEPRNLWEEALEVKEVKPAPRVLTWDSLRSAFPHPTRYTSPFLSEGTAATWEAEAARLPNSATLAASPAYTSQELVANLLTVCLGMDSQLFAWNGEKEGFGWRKDVKSKGREGEQPDGRLWGASIDDSASLVEAFLSIGTALVRLEAVVQALATSTPHSTPSRASHAISTALSTFLFHVRTSLALLRPPSGPLPSLLSLSTQVAPLLSLLTSLTTLFEPPLSLSTASLLSRLYFYLEKQLAHSLTPPLLGQAVAAWLFDGAVQGWWNGWEDWVGVGNGEGWRDVGIEERKIVRRIRGVLGGEEEEEEEGALEFVLQTSRLPSFFPKAIAMELFEAGRSLRLLRKAKADHPLCRWRGIEGTGRGLLWKEGDVDSYLATIDSQVSLFRREIAAWRSGFPTPLLERPPPASTFDDANDRHSPPPSTKYQPELASLFSLFDLPPGATHNAHSVWRADTQQSSLLDFLSSLLTSATNLTILPSSLPSLSILLTTSLYTPLRTFARLPSSSLLTLFFSDLALSSHLTILHSYFLLGDQSFARRLRESLFSPPEEREGVSIRRRRRRDQVAFGVDRGELGEEREAWGAGMGIHLNDRKTWPPGGAELSLMLRTTLVDSIVEVRDVVEGRETGERDGGAKEGEVGAWSDLEARLSFAVRDGEEEEEKRWSDPQSLSALDFLYLDYKPPSPLDLVFTPAILDKYNKIFSHLLRLLRIEAVARAIWTDVSKPNLPSTPSGRVTTPTRVHLLDSDPVAKRELQSLAFEARGLVGSICSFSFDAAVEGNYQLFRKAVEKVQRGAAMREGRAGRGDEEGESWNLDSLVSLHAHFLDRIQQALLLKTKQAPLLKVVQSGIFGVVLLLGRRTKEWRRREGGEGWDPGAVRREINAMHDKLRTQASMLVVVLQALDEKGTGKAKAQQRPAEYSPSLPKELDIPLERGASYITELLVRLDANRWYSNREER